MTSKQGFRKVPTKEGVIGPLIVDAGVTCYFERRDKQVEDCLTYVQS